MIHYDLELRNGPKFGQISCAIPLQVGQHIRLPANWRRKVVFKAAKKEKDDDYPGELKAVRGEAGVVTVRVDHIVIEPIPPDDEYDQGGCSFTAVVSRVYE